MIEDKQRFNEIRSFYEAEYPYLVSLPAGGNFTGRAEWCVEMFGETWGWFDFNGITTFCFSKEEHRTWFTLRWL